MIKKIIPVALLLIFTFTLTGCSQNGQSDANQADGGNETSNNNNTTQNQTTQNQTSDDRMSSAEAVADTLEVYYFHSSQRCYSCKTAGEYISELIKEKYSQELKEGRIVFGQINVDSRENKELARKFEATGSSLYFNRIINDQDNIRQETRIWRLLGNEAQFKSYLSNMIDSYLGI